MEWSHSKVLVVDDELDALELVGYTLKKAGLQTFTAEDGIEALTKACELHPDLIVLDVMLPRMDGMEVCRTLRGKPETASIPIIMLTARSNEIDRILGLEYGADDYMTKPFSPRELLLRIRNLLRPRPVMTEMETYQFQDLQIDVAEHQVRACGEPIELTLTEFRLLTLLAQRPGRVQSREQLLRDVWSDEGTVDTRTIDTHIRRLREKLGMAARHVETVRGVGYRFLEKSSVL